MTIIDALGLIGVVFILVAYVALQFEKLAASDWRYSALNAVGAALILLTLIYDFNMSAFAMEFAWLVISLFGLVKSLRPSP